MSKVSAFEDAEHFSEWEASFTANKRWKALLLFYFSQRKSGGKLIMTINTKKTQALPTCFEARSAF